MTYKEVAQKFIELGFIILDNVPYNCVLIRGLEKVTLRRKHFEHKFNRFNFLENNYIEYFEDLDENSFSVYEK